MKIPHAAAFLILTLALLPDFSVSQTEKPVFKRISLELGLPASRVNAIVQSNDGVIWFGTRNGFCKYENSTITVYQPGSPEGGATPNNDVRAIYEDRSGMLWIGIFGGGIYRFDRVSGKLTQYRHSPTNPNSLSDDRVLSILEDRDGTLWIGTVNGANIFDRNTLNFSHITYDPENPYSLSENRVWPLAEDRTGSIWIGTLGGGLNKLDKSTGTIRVFQHDASSSSLANNSVVALLSDRSGVLWIGMENGGLSRFVHERDEFDRQREEFKSYLHGLNVSSITEDTSGNIIAGTLGSGLKIIDRATGNATTIANDPADPKSLSDNNIRCVYVDKAGTLWVGTENGGVCQGVREEPKPRKPRRGFN